MNLIFIICIGLCAVYGEVAQRKTSRRDLGFGMFIGMLTGLFIACLVAFNNAIEHMSLINLGLGGIRLVLYVVVVYLIGLVVLCCLKRSTKDSPVVL